MGILNPNPKEKPSKDLRATSLLMTIPAILIAGPLVGIFGGEWLDEKFDTDPIFITLGIILGFASAGYETYKLIKKAEMIEKEKDDTK
jgi:F0F1-type ATP synthase assembly protein I